MENLFDEAIDLADLAQGGLLLPFSDPIVIVLILLATALIIPLIAHRLRLPDIVLLILAGIALGPHGSGVLAREQDAVALFSVVGLLLLMFLAGLEIDIREYRKNRAKSFIFGTLTFIMPMILGTLAGLFIMGMGILESVLLASLLASHTLLAYPEVSRLRIGGDESVTITIGGTIIANVAALLVLSVVVSLHTGEMTSGFIISSSAKLILFMFFVISLLPRIAGWVLNRLEGDGKMQFLFVFVVLFFSGLLADLSGIEPIIGAFMSGIAVGRFVPPVSPLGNRLEFFGSAIFIPAFLISVGMLVDVRAIFADLATLIAALVMTATVIIAKWVAAYFSQKFFSWNKERREFVFGLSVGQAAGTLAAVMVGYRIGLFGHDILNGAIVTIFVTAIISPIIVLAMGRRIAQEAASAETGQDFSRRRILIGAQEKAGSERLLELAMLLHDPKGITDMRAVTVMDSQSDTQKRVEAIEKHLSAYARDAAAAGHKIDFGPRIAASVAAGLANGAGEFMASDIVIGLGQRRNILFSKVGVTLTELAARSGVRILAARLSSSLATVSRMSLFLPSGIELEEDFTGALAAVKSFVRQGRFELVCCGSPTSLANARGIFEATAPLAGITWEECGHDTLCRRIKKSEGIRCILLARQDGASWSREMRQVKKIIDELPNEIQFIVVCPAVKRAETFGASVIPGALGKFWDALRRPWGSKKE